MRTALTGPHLEQENVRHLTSLRVTCGSMRLRYVNLKQTGHWPTVMTDIVSLHDGSMPPLDWAALNRFGRRCRPRFNRRPSVTKYARRLVSIIEFLAPTATNRDRENSQYHHGDYDADPLLVTDRK